MTRIGLSQHLTREKEKCWSTKRPPHARSATENEIARHWLIVPSLTDNISRLPGTPREADSNPEPV